MLNGGTERMYHRIDRQERSRQDDSLQSSAWIDSKGRGRNYGVWKIGRIPGCKGQGAYGGSIVGLRVQRLSVSENWKIVYADSEETRSGNRTADKIYDLQESTFWQTVDNTAYPHQVVIDLGKEYNVTGFRILPRAEQGAPGMIKDYKVYVKTTGFGY